MHPGFKNYWFIPSELQPKLLLDRFQFASKIYGRKWEPCDCCEFLALYIKYVSRYIHIFIPSPTVKFTCLYLSLIVFVCQFLFYSESLMSCLCYVQFCFPSLVSLILFSRVPSCVHSALMPSSVYLCCVVPVSSVFPL